MIFWRWGFTSSHRVGLCSPKFICIRCDLTNQSPRPLAHGTSLRSHPRWSVLNCFRGLSPAGQDLCRVHCLVSWNQLHSPPSDPGKADGPHQWAESQKASWLQGATPQHPAGRREESPCQRPPLLLCQLRYSPDGDRRPGRAEPGKSGTMSPWQVLSFCLQNLHPLLSPMVVSPTVQPIHAPLDACTSPFSDSTYSSRK